MNVYLINRSCLVDDPRWIWTEKLATCEQLRTEGFAKRLIDNADLSQTIGLKMKIFLCGIFVDP